MSTKVPPLHGKGGHSLSGTSKLFSCRVHLGLTQDLLSPDCQNVRAGTSGNSLRTGTRVQLTLREGDLPGLLGGRSLLSDRYWIVHPQPYVPVGERSRDGQGRTRVEWGVN